MSYCINYKLTGLRDQDVTTMPHLLSMWRGFLQKWLDFLFYTLHITV